MMILIIVSIISGICVMICANDIIDNIIANISRHSITFTKPIDAETLFYIEDYIYFNMTEGA